MYSWINSEGQTIKTDTIAEFARKYNFPPSMARTLACGKRARLRGFCSTHPRAKKFRDRFTTTLINLNTGEKKILGPSVKKFARDHDLSLQGFSELINRRVLLYRGWTLESSVALANLHTPCTIF